MKYINACLVILAMLGACLCASQYSAPVAPFEKAMEQAHVALLVLLVLLIFIAILAIANIYYWMGRYHSDDLTDRLPPPELDAGDSEADATWTQRLFRRARASSPRTQPFFVIKGGRH